MVPSLKNTALIFPEISSIKVGINLKAALTSLNTAFLPISLTHFKRH